MLIIKQWGAINMDNKIQHTELKEMFGDMLPIEAISVIQTCDDENKTPDQTRAALRLLAKEMHAKEMAKPLQERALDAAHFIFTVRPTSFGYDSVMGLSDYERERIALFQAIETYNKFMKDNK